MKRVFDIIGSSVGLLLLSPLFIVVALAIKLSGKGPVFFSQKRIGKDFKPFTLYKFRTMNHDVFSCGVSCTAMGDARITSVGRILRKIKVDELPQLWNVLKGEMSLVGPRPEVPKYVEMFKNEYAEILKVRPGITDYAAIEFRDEEKLLEKFNDPEKGYVREVLPKKIVLYKKYLANKSLSTDIKLILKTLWQ